MVGFCERREREFLLTEQLRMSAGAVENYFFGIRFDAVYKKPIRFDMTLPPIFVVAMQRMVFMLWQKWLLCKKQTHYFIEFAHIFVLFFHKFAIFFKRAIIFRSVH